MRLVAGWLVGVLCLLPAPVAAQASAADSVLQRLRPDARVRVHRIGGERVLGRMQFAGDGSVSVLAREDGSIIPISDVDSLWRRRANTGRGAAIGAVVAGVPSLIFFGWVGAVLDEGEESDFGYITRVALTGGLLGAAAGATVGALIGASTHRWQLVYATETPKSALQLHRQLDAKQTRVGVSFAW